MSDFKKQNDDDRLNELSGATDVLHALLQNSKFPISDQYLRWKVWSQWEMVVGPSMAKQTIPVDFKDGVLFVWVKSSSWMQEMRFLAADILTRVNDFVGRPWAHFIKFTLHRHEVPAFGNQNLSDAIAAPDARIGDNAAQIELLKKFLDLGKKDSSKK